ncbi:TonB family protein [Rubellimicrobium rubrum]|nr:TonB family protein [Rubellimicrobium rubrum]
MERPLRVSVAGAAPTLRHRANSRATASIMSASAAGHVAVLAWLLASWGGAPEPFDIEVTEVTAVSEAEYVRAVAAGMVPVAATPVEAVERIEAASATQRLGSASEELLAGTLEPARAQPARSVPPARVEPRPVAPAARADRATAMTAEPGVPASSAAPRVTPAQPLEPSRSAANVVVSEVIEALPEEPRPTEVDAAPRPPERPSNLTSEPEPDRQVAQPVPVQGNADVEMPQGTQAGQADGTASRQAQAAQAEAQASAAAASYPAQVMQRLSRTRRDRIREAGTAVISFTVADDGGLAALAVAQGSGIPVVDQAGLALVQRAAPFPVPPAGAQRSFSFQFTGN